MRGWIRAHMPIGESRRIVNWGLLKALVALVPAGLVFRLRRPALVLQLLGAIGLVVVVATHFCEALRLFPSMHWGAEHSVGHYLDLGSAVGGFTLFPIGYLLHAFAERKASVAQD